MRSFEEEVEQIKQELGLKAYETPRHNYCGLREALKHNCIKVLKLRKSGFLGSKEYWEEVKRVYHEELKKWYDPRPSFMWCRQKVEMEHK